MTALLLFGTQMPFRTGVYHDYEQVSALLHEWGRAYPQLCELESIGECGDGKQIWLLTLTEKVRYEPCTVGRAPACPQRAQHHHARPCVLLRFVFRSAPVRTPTSQPSGVTRTCTLAR